VGGGAGAVVAAAAAAAAGGRRARRGRRRGRRRRCGAWGRGAENATVVAELSPGIWCAMILDPPAAPSQARPLLDVCVGVAILATNAARRGRHRPRGAMDGAMSFAALNAKLRAGRSWAHAPTARCQRRRDAGNARDISAMAGNTTASAGQNAELRASAATADAARPRPSSAGRAPRSTGERTPRGSSSTCAKAQARRKKDRDYDARCRALAYAVDVTARLATRSSAGST